MLSTITVRKLLKEKKRKSLLFTGPEKHKAYLGPHSKIEGRGRRRETETETKTETVGVRWGGRPGTLLLLRSRVEVYGFGGSLFIDEFKT